MNKQKPLIIDKRDKVKGLFTYCQKCQRLIDNRKCGKTGKRLITCRNVDKHMFKAIVTIPGTEGTKRKTKIFKTRNLELAIQLKHDFVNSLIVNDYQTTTVISESENRPKPVLLIECMAMYIGYLNNEGVVEHKVKVRTEKHIKEVEYYFEKFCRCLLKHNIDHTLFKTNQLNDRIVALFHNYLLEDMNYANKTYNKIIALFRQFFNWLNENRGYELRNPFKEVIRRKVILNKEVLSMDEFEKLISIINENNGYQVYPSGERKNRFKPWLINAFQLALETGLRREEFMLLKFSDIDYDKSGLPQFLKIENFKVNRQKGLDSKVGEKKYVPITKSLQILLIDLGYDEYKDSDRFLLGGNEKSSRATLIDFVSKAFTHFWKQTGFEKKVQLKSLRKTYLTALVEHFGDKAPIISNHSGIAVLKKHYVNDKQLVLATKDFSVFKKSM